MSKLQLHNISVLGDEGQHILNINEFSINSGDFLALKGISGAGKSTFLNTIAGIIKPNSGEVLWDGINIATINEAKKAQFRRDNLGIIFQNSPLFDELSLFENITVAANYNPRNKKNIEDNAKRLMDYFGFDDLARNTKNYSGGQKQRIAVMRALAANPPIIIADEPTASLDKDNAKILIDYLCQQAGDKTLIITSHDEMLLAKADNVFTIADGVISDER